MWPFPKPLTVDALLKLMRSANEPPSDENLEAQKTELINLAREARKEVLKQDPQQSGVVTLPDLSPKSGITPDTADWFVVGDLHSDYQSLSRILLKIYLRPGINPDKVRIIFLGDYVDRGDRPMQVLRLLLSLKKNWPDHFWLLQGNHESYEILEDGTTLSSVSPRDTIDGWKPHFGEEVFRALAELFAVLPVAFIQTLKRSKETFSFGSEKILYVHGGIPRKDYIRLLLDAPECRGGFIWSDPELEKEEVVDAPGKRFSFARRQFHDFMEHHGFSLLIRGHEWRKDGFDLHEEVKDSMHRMLTIFSCGGAFQDQEKSDSHYKSEILVPRFLHIQPNSPFDLPLSVEEVYRDDIQISGNLGQNNRALLESLVASFKEQLGGSDGLSLHVYSDLQLDDLSNKYDSSDSYVRLVFNLGSGGEITYKVGMNNLGTTGSFRTNPLELNDEVSSIIAKIQNAYPIFGILPIEYFNQKKEKDRG